MISVVPTFFSRYWWLRVIYVLFVQLQERQDSWNCDLEAGPLLRLLEAEDLLVVALSSIAKTLARKRTVVAIPRKIPAASTLTSLGRIVVGLL